MSVKLCQGGIPCPSPAACRQAGRCMGAPIPQAVAPPDPVHQPPHYARFVFEPATFITANGLSFLEGNVVKYTVRAPYKGKRLEDLRKARRCLDMLIETAEREARIAAGEDPRDVWKVML